MAKRCVLGALIMVMAVATACQASLPIPAGAPKSSALTVNPADADPATTSDSVNVNLAYPPDDTTTPRHKLVVILPGTTGQTGAYQKLSGAYTSAGFDVIVLRYSSDVQTQGACPDSVAVSDPDCHRRLRSEVTFGSNIPGPTGPGYDHAAINVSKADSVVNRLVKLVDRLNTVDPSAGWGQFQRRSGATCTQVNTTYGGCNLDWSKVVLVGHSQGSGIALYLAKFFSVSAVGLISGTYDAFNRPDGSAIAAPWVREPLATPVNRITALYHTKDDSLVQIKAVLDAVGVIGPAVDAPSSTPPYGGSHRLVTSVPSTCPWDWSPSHNSTAVDLCTPDFLYVPAWQYTAGA